MFCHRIFQLAVTLVLLVFAGLPASDPATYLRIARPDFGGATFCAVIDFVVDCVGHFSKVTLTAVDLAGVDLEECRRLAQELGVEFRGREYQLSTIGDLGLWIED